MKMKSFSRMVPFMSSWMNTAGALRRLSHNGFRSDRLPDFAPPPEVPVNVAVTPSTAASIRKAEQFAIEHKEIARWLLAIFTLVTTLTVAIVQNRNAVEHAALKNEIDILKTQLGTERLILDSALHADYVVARESLTGNTRPAKPESHASSSEQKMK